MPEKITTDSGIEIKPVYSTKDVQNLPEELPGQYPFQKQGRQKQGKRISNGIQRGLTGCFFIAERCTI